MSIEIFSAFKNYSQLRESQSHYKETKHTYLERFLARVSVMFLLLLNIRTIGAVTFAIAWDTFLYSSVTGVSWKQSQVVTDSVIMPCFITRNKLVQVLVSLIVVSLLLMLLPRVMFFFFVYKVLRQPLAYNFRNNRYFMHLRSFLYFYETIPL